MCPSTKGRICCHERAGRPVLNKESVWLQVLPTVLPTGQLQVETVFNI